jgi:hypothetical protein
MSDQACARPGKLAIALGVLLGVAFVLAGLAAAPVFGILGVCWALVAGGVAAFYGVHLFGSRGPQATRSGLVAGAPGGRQGKAQGQSGRPIRGPAARGSARRPAGTGAGPGGAGWAG